MKILIANKFFYPRGGDCVYSIGLQKLLEDNGHEVAVFAMTYPENIPSKWTKYYPSEVAFSIKKPLQFLKALIRPIYSFEVATKFNKLLDDFKPDVVHLNNIHTQLSPLIATIAHKRGIRVVWTLHDYKLLCPRYDCLRNGQPCELCFKDKSNVLKYSCLKGSRLASFIAWLEAKVWSRSRLESNVDVFICPSKFLKRKMEQGGFNSNKLVAIHNFIDSEKVEGTKAEKGNHYCYVGRLSEEKGIRTLLKVASQLSYTIKIIGTGPLEKELHEQYGSLKQIEFLGHCHWPQIREVLGSARCMVLPSEWYENNPLSIIESLGLGTPVIGADIGGIPELITSDSYGTLFIPGDIASLRKSIINTMDTSRKRADPLIDTLFSNSYYFEMMGLYNPQNSKI
jgi:glycosyltransferase involved in cell wall biosynthesis